ncbi:MAG TPA: fumarylacetoacetate hydrolase family protein [Bacilli bacterium]
MKLLQFIENGNIKLGIKTNQGILDVAMAADLLMLSSYKGIDIHDVIEGGEERLARLADLAERALSHPESARLLLDENGLEWASCVTRPGKIICIGLNYRKHALETGQPTPQYPILFNKFNNTLHAHLKPVSLPKVSAKVDYEAELGVVIGKRAKYLDAKNALDCVFGYCCANDLSARDLQLRTSQWLLGKCCDGFSPVGPYLVTSDEVGDPNQLAIRCAVNGEIRQQSNTADMIFSVAEIVSYISQHMTLFPGDVIFTGTPEGVVLGYPPMEQVYLQPGDVVTVEIEKLGALTNRMAAECEKA